MASVAVRWRSGQFGQCFIDLSGQRCAHRWLRWRQAWIAGGEAGGDRDDQTGGAGGQLLQRQTAAPSGWWRRGGDRIEQFAEGGQGAPGTGFGDFGQHAQRVAQAAYSRGGS